ncbi:MAG TPA: magnesium chelatase, partial [Planctomycetes bacterium]|nr:magnesium chelatase [Planctomycetota bacterium]
MDPHTEFAGSIATLKRRLHEAIEPTVIGLGAEIDLLLVALLARGHALLEGVPGIAKTLLARSFAAALGAEFQRIQFTPDLLPADVTGGTIFDRRTGEFVLRKGPVFTQVLLADEINRSPAKTQSALLEAMQERQVTIDG